MEIVINNNSKNAINKMKKQVIEWGKMPGTNNGERTLSR